MEKILTNSSLYGKTLRNRNDIPPLLKTAVHRFNNQSQKTFDAWLLLLTGGEKQTVLAFLDIKEKQ